jgi:homoserine dehydrogenase
MLVSCHSQLGTIENEFNGIMVRGDCTGDVVFYGKGAGSMPTASAVVADMVDCCHHLKTRRYLFWADSDNGNVIPYSESETAMYVRISSDYSESVLIKAKELFGELEVLDSGDKHNEIAFVTPVMKIGEIDALLEKLTDGKAEVSSKIRVSDF